MMKPKNPNFACHLFKAFIAFAMLLLSACQPLPAIAVSFSSTPLTPLAPSGTSQPFELPTFHGDQPSHQVGDPERPPSLPNTAQLFDHALNCWPENSFLRAELNLEGRLSSLPTSQIDSAGLFSLNNTRASASLVARIPLYSAVELDKEREREQMRRHRAAAAVSDLVVALSEKARLQRELAFAIALERRAQERAISGVAETREQFSMTEKVAQIDSQLISQEGHLQRARLELMGLCEHDKAAQLQSYIDQYLKGR